MTLYCGAVIDFFCESEAISMYVYVYCILTIKTRLMYIRGEFNK